MDLVVSQQDNRFERQSGDKMSKEEFQDSANRIVDWIHGLGEKLLESQRALPRSFQEADDMRKAHEQLEFKCMQGLTDYARLSDVRYRGDDLPDTLVDGLDQMVQEFLQKLQKRRTLVVSFYTFYRLLQEVDIQIDELRRLCDAVDTSNLEATQKAIERLTECLKSLENKVFSARNESERLRPVVATNPTLSEDIESNLEAAKERVVDASARVRLRLLELRKAAQLLACERDVMQVVEWLVGLGQLVFQSYREVCVGKTPVESAELLRHHDDLFTKAKDMYEYGRKLVHAYQLMCQTERIPPSRANQLEAQVQDVWNRLDTTLAEVRERMEVAETVYKNVDVILARVETALLQISRELDARATIRQVKEKHSAERDQINKDFDTTKEVGFALMHRVKTRIGNEPEFGEAPEVDQTQVVIKMKLYTLWIKIRELDYYLGRRKQVVATEFEDVVIMIRIQLDKLFDRMNFHEQQWKFVALPKTLPDAVSALSVHTDAKREIEELYRRVQEYLEPLTTPPKSAGQENAAVEAAEASREALNRARTRKREWDNAWVAHEDKLRLRYDLLIRLRDLDLDIEECWKRLCNLRDQPLMDLRVVQEINSGVMALRDNVPSQERGINALFSDIERAVDQDFAEQVDKTGRNWENYKRNLDLLAVLLDIVLQILLFLPRLDDFRVSVPDRSRQCRGPEEIDRLLDEIDDMVAKASSFEVDKLLRTSHELSGNEEPVRPIVDRLNGMTDMILDLRGQINGDVVMPTIEQKQQKSLPMEDVPRLTGQLKDTEAPEGGRLVLECTYEGFPEAPQVTWLRNGIPLAANTGRWQENVFRHCAVLASTRVEQADEGIYDCIIKDARSSRQLKSTARVHVIPTSSGPRITGRLGDLEASEGGPTELSCEFDGMPEPPQATWQHNGVPITTGFGRPWQEQVTKSKATLTNQRVTPRDEGMYSCRVKDRRSGAQLESSGQLRILSVPRFTRGLQPRTALEGDPVLLQCQLADTSSGPGPHITWFLDGRPVDPVRPPAGIVVDNGDGVCALKIDSARPTHAGTYRCEARNTAGETSTNADLTISESRYPKVIGQLEPPSNIKIGGPMTMTVYFDAAPTPEIHWYKANRSVADGGRFKIDSYPTRSNLTVDRVTPDDAGVYSVVVKNPLGSDKSSCDVRIGGGHRAPVFVTPPADEDVREGQPTRLTCRIDGTPAPQVRWRKGGREIQTDRDFTLVNNSPPGEYSLKIGQAYLEDSGEYTILAENAAGSTQNTCVLRVQQRLSVVGPRKTSATYQPTKFTDDYRDSFDSKRPKVKKEEEPIQLTSPNTDDYRGSQKISPRQKFYKLFNKPGEDTHDDGTRSPDDKRVKSVKEFRIGSPRAEGVEEPEFERKTSNRMQTSFWRPEPKEDDSRELEISTPVLPTPLDVPLPYSPKFFDKDSVCEEPLSPIAAKPKTAYGFFPPHTDTKRESMGSASITIQLRPKKSSADYPTSPAEDVKKDDVIDQFASEVRRTEDVYEEHRDDDVFKHEFRPICSDDSTTVRERKSQEFHHHFKSVSRSEEMDGVFPAPYESTKNRDYNYTSHVLTHSTSESKFSVGEKDVDDAEDKDTFRASYIPGDRLDSEGLDYEEDSSDREVVRTMHPKSESDSYERHEHEWFAKCVKVTRMQEVQKRSEEEWEETHKTSRASDSNRSKGSFHLPSITLQWHPEKSHDTISSGCTHDLLDSDSSDDQTAQDRLNKKDDYIPSSHHKTSLTETQPPSAPSVITELHDSDVPDNGNLLLKARASGQPPPNANWLKDGHTLTPSRKVQMRVDGDEYTLEIEHVTISDAGEYRLLLSNTMGRNESSCRVRVGGQPTDKVDYVDTGDHSKRTTLIFSNTIVRSPPEFLQLFGDEVVKAGETVILTSRITGIPEPTVWWSFNGEFINSSRYQFVTNDDRFSLVINYVNLEDSGRYSVTAENSSGVATCSALVLVEEFEKTGFSRASAPMSRSSSRPMSPHVLSPMLDHMSLGSMKRSKSTEAMHHVTVQPRYPGEERGPESPPAFTFETPRELKVDVPGSPPKDRVISIRQSVTATSPLATESSPKKPTSGGYIVRTEPIESKLVTPVKTPATETKPSVFTPYKSPALETTPKTIEPSRTPTTESTPKILTPRRTTPAVEITQKTVEPSKPSASETTHKVLSPRKTTPADTSSKAVRQELAKDIFKRKSDSDSSPGLERKTVAPVSPKIDSKELAKDVFKSKSSPPAAAASSTPPRRRIQIVREDDGSSGRLPATSPPEKRKTRQSDRFNVAESSENEN